MYGAMIGDMVGSTFEWDNLKSKEFELFREGSRFTDDTVMTLAVAKALMPYAGLSAEELRDEEQREEIRGKVVKALKEYGLRYPRAGYGGRFSQWLRFGDKPYNSYGNGSAMRVSSVGWLFDDIDAVREAAALSAEVTHNHPEGIKGAEAVASALFLARSRKSKEEIKAYIQREFHYDLDRSCDEIRPGYSFDVSCQGSVPEAIIAFLESTDYEDAIRNGISLGGDSDTIGAMTGAIAEAFYGVPKLMIEACKARLPEDLKAVALEMEAHTVCLG